MQWSIKHGILFFGNLYVRLCVREIYIETVAEVGNDDNTDRPCRVLFGVWLRRGTGVGEEAGTGIINGRRRRPSRTRPTPRP